MRDGLDRRAFLACVSALTTATLAPASAQAPRGKTRLILLGSGGPRPRKANSASAQVIVIDGAAYVVDCGDGVARQLVSAGVPLATLRHVFITHQHSDHTADYGNLLWLGWTAGLRTRVDTWGPPPLAKMTRLFFEMNGTDIETRIADEGRVPLAPLVHVHELTAGGLVVQDDHVKVTAALVKHPPVVPSFGYRFDTADLERGRPRADDHRGAKDGDGRTVFGQHRFDFTAQGEVLAQTRRVGCAQAPEIHDAAGHRPPRPADPTPTAGWRACAARVPGSGRDGRPPAAGAPAARRC